MMRKRTSITLLFTAVVAIVALLAAAEVMAQGGLPTDCDVDKYTITHDGATTSGGITTHNYSIHGTRSAIQKINRIVIVVTRPIEPGHIVSPAEPGEFCDPDPATKINEGDCDSFSMSITPEPVTDKRQEFKIETTVSTQGTVTMNVITGTTGIHTCEDSGRGILGPGVEFDPVAPGQQEFTYQIGECTLTVQKDPITGDIVRVTTTGENCYVDVDGDPIQNLTLDGDSIGFAADDTIMQSHSSPGCYTYFYRSRYWRICQ